MIGEKSNQLFNRILPAGIDVNQKNRLKRSRLSKTARLKQKNLDFFSNVLEVICNEHDGLI